MRSMTILRNDLVKGGIEFVAKVIGLQDEPPIRRAEHILDISILDLVVSSFRKMDCSEELRAGNREFLRVVNYAFDFWRKAWVIRRAPVTTTVFKMVSDVEVFAQTALENACRSSYARAFFSQQLPFLSSVLKVGDLPLPEWYADGYEKCGDATNRLNPRGPFRLCKAWPPQWIKAPAVGKGGFHSMISLVRVGA